MKRRGFLKRLVVGVVAGTVGGTALADGGADKPNPAFVFKSGPSQVGCWATDAVTSELLGFTWAPVGDRPVWAFVQTHGYCDGVCPRRCDLAQPISQPMDCFSEVQNHKDGYTTMWISPEGCRIYTYCRVVRSADIERPNGRLTAG